MSPRPSTAGSSPRSGLRPQVLRQQPDALIFASDAGGAAAAVPGQLLGRPPLGGRGQPRLGDPGERQPSPGWPKTARSQVSLACSLPGSASARRTWRANAASSDRARLPGARPRIAVLDRGDLLAAQRVADRPQVHVGDPRAAADALLHAEQHLDDHQRRQRPQVHLPGLGDSRFPGPPRSLVQARRAPAGHAPPLVVGVAVAARAVGRPGARRHQAGRQRRQRPHPRIGQELLQRDRRAPPAELPGVRLAQHRAAAPSARTGIRAPRSAPRAGSGGSSRRRRSRSALMPMPRSAG